MYDIGVDYGMFFTADLQILCCLCFATTPKPSNPFIIVL